MAFLKLNEVSFSYPRQDRPVLSGIDLALEQEGIAALVGPNGSGKTTLTKLMVGILSPSAGEVYLEERSLRNFSLAQIGRRIGYIFQNPDHQLFCSTVAEEIGFGLKHRGWPLDAITERVKFLLDYFELTPYRKAFPLHLSRGEKQRVAMAAVLAPEPAFLILDEPTVGLDLYRKKLLGDYLKKIARLGRGTLVVSHDHSFVQNTADRVVVLERGRIQGCEKTKGQETR
ncbi:energy-coupling factor ABC transporter ATP-binding protein [Candidatus Formimonas warabiya]|uniref:Cobalt ABC transporter ATP-binding protein n=1 Tax=Formimonas warabiya TaxID=1761012 RepID=A0A3G1KR06_FORW1|nr:ABC transporter ATP-binding protein [Candidatus Formimonas warabiya]ATW24912.1 cobalt ABC transporter ATP-binding protein [Candidatus Formimonas warabiya]